MAERVGTFYAGLEVDRGAERKVSGQVGSIAKKAAGVFVAAFAVRGAFNFLKDSVGEAKGAEAAQAKLADAFARFPALADTNQSALQGLNSELQKKTRFDDDATAAAQAQLALFGLTGNQLKTLTPLVQDYAAKTGQDLGSAAQGVGKALLGQGRALKQVGINFKDTGSLAGNFESVVGSLGTKVGGFAEKEGKKAAGQTAILGNRFGELKESIGTQLLPALSSLIDLAKPLLDFLTRNSAVLLPLVGGIVAVVAAYKIWTAAQALLNIVLTANPIGLIVVAIAGLVAGIVIAYKKSETFRNIVKKAFDVVKGAVMGVWNAFKPLIEIIKKVAGVYVRLLVSAFRGVVSVVRGVIDIFRAVVSTARSIFGKIAGFVGRIIEKFKDIAGNIIGGLVDGIKNGAKKVINAIKDFVLSKIPAFVKKFFGIGSPSKLMAGFGRNIVEGLAVGITAGASSVPAALDRVLRPLSVPSFAPISLGGAGVAAAAASTVSQTITVNEVANDPIATARAVAARIGMAATR